MQLFRRKRFIECLDKLRYQRDRFSRRSFLANMGIVTSGLLFIPFHPRSFLSLGRNASSPGAILNIVAHEDDDLLFLSPDLLHNVQAGGSVRTIYITAGDAGEGTSYWQGRESGSKAAYAQMSGVANSWTKSDAGIAGHPISLFTLTAKPTISLAFLQLPDGNIDGSGFSANNDESLEKLWSGEISTIHAIDGSSSYSKSTLTNTLVALMSSFQPSQICTQDYVGSYGDGDHSDHHTVAYFTQTAQQQYSTTHVFTGYQDYNTSSLPANVAGADLTAKQNAFFTYSPHDANVCQSVSSCAKTNYGIWLKRQYTVTANTGGNQPPVANAGVNQTVVVNTTVQLDGSGSSDPNNNSLTYQWTQTAGPSVTLSSSTAVKPTFTAPATATTLTFQLVVNNGQTNSSPAAVTITISGSIDLALSATATASSQNTDTGQLASSAIDGVIDGYPGDFTKEWATVGGGAGSWLKLTWTSAQTVSRIVLYDRPNLNDQVTGGNIQFSDGTSVAVGTLNNDGSATTITFAAKTITSLQFNITSVSSSTQNVGLAEIQVYTS